jgi:hypothetical protein
MMKKQTWNSFVDRRIWRLRMNARAQMIPDWQTWNSFVDRRIWMIPDWPMRLEAFELTLTEIMGFAKSFGVTPGTVDRVFCEEFEAAIRDQT